MKYRTLGHTEIRVSEIGFGAWGIGGNAEGAIGYGATDDALSKDSLREAVEHGITFFDTANLYGFGHSEKLIGETFRDMRDKVVLATKVGFLGPNGPQDFSPQHLHDSLEMSLQRLQTDHVDLYQLHNPPVSLFQEDGNTLETLRTLQRQGKIRAFGVSLRTPDDGLTLVRDFGISCVQVNFNLVDQRALVHGLLDLCAKEGIGLIIRTPLCFGFLSGKYSADSAFGEEDHRSQWSREQLALWAGANRSFQNVLGSETGTEAQLALRFCLSFPGVSTVIPGMLMPQHVRENAMASHQGPLEISVLQRLAHVYQENRFFLGKKG